MRRHHAVALLSAFQALFLHREVGAVRTKKGCYDDYAMTCDEHKVPLEDIDFDLEEVCYRIANEVLLDDYVTYYKQHLHPEYLNGIEFKDPFCTQMQAAYSHCAFCAGLRHSRCKKQTVYTACGGRPTKEVLLEDNEKYPEFRSEADIDRTCNQLQHIKNQTDPKKRYPHTLDLCKRVKHAKHLCDGECEGGCFDEEDHPPICNIQQENATFETEAYFHETCNMIRNEAFGELDNEQTFSASKRLDYLRAIPKDHPNCTEYRQAYPHCFWCMEQDALCFHQSKPPSCNKTKIEKTDFGDRRVHDLIDEGCQILFKELTEHLPHQNDFYDVSKHGKHLFLMKNTYSCNLTKQVYHKCLWCEEDVSQLPCLTKDPCFIDVEVPEHVTNSVIEAFTSVIGDDVCGPELWEYSREHFRGPFTKQTCYQAIAATRLCKDMFCPNITEAREFSKDYLGATTEGEKMAIIWASRLSAILSFLGATFILWDILRDKNARSTVYHQLLIGMAIFDLVTAFAWCFTTAPIDRNDSEAAHVEGVMGSDATCTAQGFFIQLGFTSIFYNVSLALYYVLVISHGWKEFQLRKIRLYMHLVPVTVGLVLAFAGIPFYHWLEYGCHIEPFTIDEDEEYKGYLWAVLLFVVVPLGLSILTITASMAFVYNSVRKRSAASRKWSFGINKASKLEQAVFWQCLFYVMAFYVTWPIVFAVYLASIDAGGPLWLAITVAFVAPLQGFSNAVVYIRPKLQNRNKASNRRPGSGRFCSSRRLIACFKRECAEAPTSTVADTAVTVGTSSTEEELRGVDPSLAIALRGDSTRRSIAVGLALHRKATQRGFASTKSMDAGSGNGEQQNRRTETENAGTITMNNIDTSPSLIDPGQQELSGDSGGALRKGPSKSVVTSLPIVMESFNEEAENQVERTPGGSEGAMDGLQAQSGACEEEHGSK